MGQKMDDWHRKASEMLYGTRFAYDSRTRMTDPVQRENAVTVWRHTAHVLSDYANGRDGDTWKPFWADCMTQPRFRALLDDRSRFNRCGADGDAPLRRDSVVEWERTLVHNIVTKERCVAMATRTGREEPARRLTLELNGGLSIAAAYTGCSLADLRNALRESNGRVPIETYRDGVQEYDDHPLCALIADNRPVR